MFGERLREMNFEKAENKNVGNICDTGVPDRNALQIWEEVLLQFTHIAHACARAVNNVTSEVCSN